MREKLKNDLLLLLNQHVDVDVLRKVEPCIETILANYEVEARKTELIPYGAILPESVEIYLVTRKIAGLSDKTLYLYHLILADFFQTLQKAPEKVTANDIRVYLYRYQKEHGTSNRTLEGRRIAICAYFKWINAEGYIDKNPTINIDPIKYERKHKKAMSQLDLEKVRLACTTKREKAIVEIWNV